jgi:hypothetical protein
VCGLRSLKWVGSDPLIRFLYKDGPGRRHMMVKLQIAQALAAIPESDSPISTSLKILGTSIVHPEYSHLRQSEMMFVIAATAA